MAFTPDGRYKYGGNLAGARDDAGYRRPKAPREIRHPDLALGRRLPSRHL
mgnify:CR=1 FL=1